MKLKQDEQICLENIQEAIGEAATHLMSIGHAIDAENIVMVLRARSMMTSDPHQKQVLDGACKILKVRVKKSA
ncbi:hypothetical protein [Enterobacter sp. ENT03]|uniref:hypothetical protein n=1 Tax=Enterobacter sp. ENT03 TaxID=2854780 RepID=UPI001C455234|nr:hypothetical protein [Enterobacter sp. ENT03]MBV7404106.1 hypothetical protein [Enterobacter sp. ENT03]